MDRALESDRTTQHHGVDRLPSGDVVATTGYQIEVILQIEVPLQIEVT
jgi:hypothetical protein